MLIDRFRNYVAKYIVVNHYLTKLNVNTGEIVPFLSNRDLRTFGIFEHKCLQLVYAISSCKVITSNWVIFGGYGICDAFRYQKSCSRFRTVTLMPEIYFMIQ